MKKKKEETEELRSLSIGDLNKKLRLLREEIAISQLEFSVNKPKDSSLIAKKRKLLARLLTIINDKKRENKN